jgi:hypothetical protein
MHFYLKHKTQKVGLYLTTLVLIFLRGRSRGYNHQYKQ